jgi:uncharacterized protein YggE
MARLLLAVPALIAVVALAGVLSPPDFAKADAPAATAPRDTVAVTGVGSVKAVPDQAEFSFGVETRGATAKAALATNASAMSKIIAALRDAGARDLATQYVSVWSISQEDGKIDGYSASNSVSATIDVAHAGDLIDAAAGAGANQVSGPNMSQRDADQVYRQALSKAISDARARAEVLAKAAGRSLGDITTISEGGATGPVPYYGKVAADAASTPIVPGQQETSATVSVTFELR